MRSRHVAEYVYAILFFTSNGFAQWKSIVLLDESPRHNYLAASSNLVDERVAATLLR
jgi:hypothetical protein